jgi:8-oxo-dGTP diphosphatase
MSTITAEKVVAYITQGDQLLVFRHTEFPEAGIQVPAGTIEPGESREDAVLREVREETGLEELTVCSFLGTADVDLAQFGRDGVHRLYFYHLEHYGRAPARWLHYERDPSDGSPAPIEFEFYWVRFPGSVPNLGQQGVFLSELHVGTADP